jgi:hypothetical protein
VLWERYQQHYGHDGDPVLVWQADTRSMNPTVSEETIEQAYRDDPVAAAAEYGALFRSDIESYLQGEWIDNAVREGLHEIPPMPGQQYAAFCDPSGGHADSYAVGISHAENGRVILDLLRARRPPFNPQAVTAEFAATLKSYGLSVVTGDRYSAEWVVSAWRECGIHYQVSERTKSAIYVECVPLFATGAIQLLDHRTLLAELRQLERRTGRGADIIDHPSRGHDDAANAACGALLLSVTRAMTETDFRKGAITVPALAAETREGLDEHFAEMGLVDLGDTAFDGGDSPFTDDDWRM